MNSRASKVYSKLMQWHDKGYAMYIPKPENEIKIGMLGFVGPNCRWVTLVDNVRTAEASRIPGLISFTGQLDTEPDAPINATSLMSQNLTGREFTGGLDIKYEHFLSIMR